jgi:hypothetical protein
MKENWFRRVDTGPFHFHVPINRKGQVYYAVGVVVFIGWIIVSAVTGWNMTHPVLMYGGWAIFGLVYGVIGIRHSNWLP